MSTEVASANSWPPAGVVLLDLPLVASFASFGIGLFIIIGVESFILSKREHISRAKSLQFSTVANLFSTFIGFLFILGLAVLPYASLPTYLIFGLFFLFLGGISTHFFKKIYLSPFILNPLVWGLIWFLIMIAEEALISIVNILNPAAVVGGIFRDLSVPFHIHFLQLLAFIVFLSVGFFLSIVSEGFCLVRLLSQPSATLGMTTLIMNIRSYAYVAIPLTIGLLLWRNIR